MDEDAVFGSREARTPGSEWSVHVKPLIESMPEDMPFTLREEQVQGKVKFTGVETVDGVESCRVKMGVTMKPASIKGMPAGFKLSSVNIKISGEKLAPVDHSLPIPADKMDQQMEFSGVIPTPAGMVSMKVFHRTVKDRVSTPVK